MSVVCVISEGSLSRPWLESHLLLIIHLFGQVLPTEPLHHAVIRTAEMQQG